ncbi:MAG: DUF1080 domain-containing protein [Verrucomicrobiales bacterium]|nr:DUF1080 domain-containing protein [Verrucomicrobiales bacterium]
MHSLFSRIPENPWPLALRWIAAGLLFSVTAAAGAEELVKARDGSGVYGYKDTPILPWCGFHVHDPDRPAPPRLNPGPAPAPTPVPSDAIVLFDGQSLSAWATNDWKVERGELVAASASSLRTRQEFGDIQLHLEWLAPAHFKGPWYDQGNNGVLLMGLYEIQIFDSWNEKLYPDGQAAAIYAQTPPRVNVTRPPGEWQSYDIIFTAPRFQGEQLLRPGRVTMLHNGVLVHLEEEIRGETGHKILPEYRRKISQGPIILAGHGCPVRFRNIWVRPLSATAAPSQPAATNAAR